MAPTLSSLLGSALVAGGRSEGRRGGGRGFGWGFRFTSEGARSVFATHSEVCIGVRRGIYRRRDSFVRSAPRVLPLDSAGVARASPPPSRPPVIGPAPGGAAEGSPSDIPEASRGPRTTRHGGGCWSESTQCAARPTAGARNGRPRAGVSRRVPPGPRDARALFAPRRPGTRGLGRAGSSRLIPPYVPLRSRRRGPRAGGGDLRDRPTPEPLRELVGVSTRGAPGGDRALRAGRPPVK